MRQGIHFISGLPRSGSTLLAAILRQNPRFEAGLSSPLGGMVLAMRRAMSQDNEFAFDVTDRQREAVLRGLFTSFYDPDQSRPVTFDTNRLWSSIVPALAVLFPSARVICCVRHVSWILDSFERLVQRNMFEPSGIYNFDPGGTVYSRTEALGSATGAVGYAYNAVKSAFFGEASDRLLLLTYETLTTQPAAAIGRLYDFIGEPPFDHDLNAIEFEASSFDRRIGAPHLHTVRRSVDAPERATILPPDLFLRFQNDRFWLPGGFNPRGVMVV